MPFNFLTFKDEFGSFKTFMIKIFYHESNLMLKKIEQMTDADVFRRRAYQKMYSWKSGCYESDKKYLKDQKSVVTVFLFQPPFITFKEQCKREITNEIFQNWNPVDYTLLYYKKLDEKFKDINYDD